MSRPACLLEHMGRVCMNINWHVVTQDVVQRRAFVMMKMNLRVSSQQQLAE